uniref:Uncharacterized protein n=1 Tax=Amphimedon queenslandica TaxID=400682 RepID=A0A1X7VVF5_AMPQE
MKELTYDLKMNHGVNYDNTLYRYHVNSAATKGTHQPEYITCNVTKNLPENTHRVLKVRRGNHQYDMAILPQIEEKRNNWRMIASTVKDFVFREEDITRKRCLHIYLQDQLKALHTGNIQVSGNDLVSSVMEVYDCLSNMWIQEEGSDIKSTTPILSFQNLEKEIKLLLFSIVEYHMNEKAVQYKKIVVVAALIICCLQKLEIKHSNIRSRDVNALLSIDYENQRCDQLDILKNLLHNNDELKHLFINGVEACCKRLIDSKSAPIYVSNVLRVAFLIYLIMNKQLPTIDVNQFPNYIQWVPHGQNQVYWCILKAIANRKWDPNWPSTVYEKLFTVINPFYSISRAALLLNTVNRGTVKRWLHVISLKIEEDAHKQSKEIGGQHFGNRMCESFSGRTQFQNPREFEMWNEMLSLQCSAELMKIWESVVENVLLSRIIKLDSIDDKIEIIANFKAFKKMKPLFKDCITEELEKSFKKFITTPECCISDQSKTTIEQSEIGLAIIKKLLPIKYPDLSLNIEAILNWDLWPTLLKIQVRHSKTSNSDQDICHKAYVIVVNISTCILDGSITVHNLEMIKEKQTRMEKLYGAIFHDKNLGTMPGRFNATLLGHLKNLLPLFSLSLINSQFCLLAIEIEQCHGTDLQIGDVVQYIWNPVFKRCCEHLESLKDRSVKLSIVDVLLDQYSEEKLQAEVSTLHRGICECNGSACTSDPFWIIYCVQRMQQYRLLCQHASTAKAFLNLKDALTLTGDFRIIEQLAAQFEKSVSDQCLQFVNESLVETGNFLHGISSDENKLSCLKIFANCQELIKWIKRETRSVLDLQQFITIALTTGSGGEDDYAQDALSNLRTIGNAFATLIYHIPKSTGYKELEENFVHVWESLKHDPTLPQKLSDCGKQIEWYKTLAQKMKGPMEETYIGQMKNINKYGCYIVGCHAEMPCSKLSDIIQMDLQKCPMTLPQQNYTIDELKHLESKLVLIMGNKSNDKEQFGEVST